MIWAHLQTIFSFRVYHALAHTSRRQRMGFAIYLFLLCTLVFYLFTGAYLRRNLPLFLKNFPQITFEKGTLTAPQEPVSAPLPGSPFQITFDASRKTPPTANEMVASNTFMFVSGNTLYMPGADGVQSKALPPSLNFSTTQDFLHQHQADLMAALRFMSFTVSLIFIPLILLFDFCMAGAVGLSFNLLRAQRVPRKLVLTWAFFLLGPLSALWMVRLWINIPLFTVAQVILCIIYMQQIFNTLSEEPYAH